MSRPAIVSRLLEGLVDSGSPCSIFPNRKKVQAFGRVKVRSATSLLRHRSFQRG